MSDKDKRIEQEVERTLAGLYGLPNLTAGNDFAFQVEQKLRRLEQPTRRRYHEPVFGLRLRPALLAAAILLNLATAAVGVLQANRTDEREQCLETISDHYSVDIAAGFEEGGDGQS